MYMNVHDCTGLSMNNFPGGQNFVIFFLQMLNYSLLELVEILFDLEITFQYDLSCKLHFPTGNL